MSISLSKKVKSNCYLQDLRANDLFESELEITKRGCSYERHPLLLRDLGIFDKIIQKNFEWLFVIEGAKKW